MRSSQVIALTEYRYHEGSPEPVCWQVQIDLSDWQIIEIIQDEQGYTILSLLLISSKNELTRSIRTDLSLEQARELMAQAKTRGGVSFFQRIQRLMGL